MTDDGQADVQTLPASEFDPRCQHTHDSVFDAPMMTVAKVKDRIAGLFLDIERLKIVDGIGHELQIAKANALVVLNFVEAHEKKAVAAAEEMAAEVEHRL